VTISAGGGSSPQIAHRASSIVRQATAIRAQGPRLVARCSFRARVLSLKSLFLLNVAIPSALELPASLQAFSAVNDGYRESGAPVKALVESVPWPRLTALRSLQLQVGGSEPFPPIDVDLGFLRALPALADLRIEYGVRHRAATPLAPFDGLSPRLRSIRVDALRPSAVKRALEAQYPRADVTVSHTGPGPDRGGCTSSPGGWHTYGSLWEAFDGRYRGTEYEALQAAGRLLLRAAPALLPRMDFDPEAEGTGIFAPSRRDLVRALEILGIR
jgi:hypothetical protein